MVNLILLRCSGDVEDLDLNLVNGTGTSAARTVSFYVSTLWASYKDISITSFPSSLFGVFFSSPFFLSFATYILGHLLFCTARPHTLASIPRLAWILYKSSALSFVVSHGLSLVGASKREMEENEWKGTPDKPVRDSSRRRKCVGQCIIALTPPLLLWSVAAAVASFHVVVVDRVDILTMRCNDDDHRLADPSFLRRTRKRRQLR